MEIKNAKWRGHAIFLIAILIGLYFFIPTLFEGPLYMHAWAQADRLAIAQGFVDNGFDFFHPQSFIYNHDYQLNYSIVHDSTITAVDFPLHEYIVGLLMWIFGTKAPWVFHLYTFVISLSGIYSLIKITELLNLKTLQQLTVILFAVTGPLFIYYQSNLLINIASLAFFIIGFYNFIKWKKSHLKSTLFFAFAFLLIAALTRTTLIIGLVALFGSMFIDWMKTKRTVLLFWFFVLLSLVLFIVFQLYKYQLKDTYGSIFLTSLLLPNSIGEYFSNIGLALSKWWNYYFTEVHYLILFGSIGIGLIKYRSKLLSDKFYWSFIILWIIGCFFFSLVMSTQFIEHNYYFFDTLFFPLLVLLVLSIRSINSILLLSITNLFLILSLLFLSIPRRELMRDSGDWDYASLTYRAYANAENWLDSIGIEKNAKILAFDAFTPNSPFIGMQRKGFAVNSYRPEILSEVYQWNFDYVTYQNNLFLNNLYAADPDFINRYEIIGTNGKITVCKKRVVPHQTNLLDFLGLTKSFLIEETSLLADQEKWSNVDSFGIIKKEVQFGPTYDFKVTPEHSLIYINGTLSNRNRAVKIILTLSDNNELLEYVTFSPEEHHLKEETIEMELLYNLLPDSKASEGRIYLYNESIDSVKYEDLKIKIFKGD